MKSWSLIILVAALIGLLVLIATLQYRWLGQISEADRERRTAALKISAQHFSEDFDRELARAFVSFQLSSDVLEHAAWDVYAAHYDRWLSQAPFPQMIKNVYIVTTRNDRPLLSKYDHKSRTVVSQEWNERFQELHQRIQKQAQDVLEGRGAETNPAIVPLDTEWPVILSPVLKISFLPERVFEKKIEPLLLYRNYTFVVLDQDYVSKEMIPALAKKYFANADDRNIWDYNLVITRRDQPARLIYSSAHQASQDVNKKADVTVGLFGLRLDLIENFSLSTDLFMPKTQSLTNAPPAIMFTAPVPSGATLNSPPDQLRIVSREAALWQLSLRHQSGSLENAVALIRRRNLLVSFGVLLLLAASMAMVLILSLRARRLAAQQMEFIAGVSHELRTPVSVVCMASANLADGVVRNEKQVRQYGTMINTEGRRLSEMVEQVLDLAGTESVRNPYRLIPMALEEPLKRAAAALRNQTGNKDVTLEIEIAENLPMVLADHRAIERAVNNLLSNALKYSSDDCWIKISAQVQPNQMLEISVTDHGMGIDPSDKPHIFKQFRRGKNALSANIPGNGLGLCLVERIIKAHGGSVTVESVLGQGSTFILRLPVAKESSENVSEQLKDASYEQKSIAD